MCCLHSGNLSNFDLFFVTCPCAALCAARPGDKLGGGGSILPMRKKEERHLINWMRTIGERCSCLSMDADPRLPKEQSQSAAQGVTPWTLQEGVEQAQGHDPSLDLRRRSMRSHRHFVWYYISGGPDRRGSGTADGDIRHVKPSIAGTDGPAEPHVTPIDRT